MLVLKIVPRASWPTQPYLGPLNLVADESGILGTWNGSAYIEMAAPVPGPKGDSGSIADGAKGDIVVSGVGTAWDIDPAVATATGRTVMAAADAAAARTALGAQATMTTTATGLSVLAAADAAAARTAIGLVAASPVITTSRTIVPADNGLDYEVNNGVVLTVNTGSLTAGQFVLFHAAPGASYSLSNGTATVVVPTNATYVSSDTATGTLGLYCLADGSFRMESYKVPAGSLAAVGLAAATSLTRIAHANRQILFNGASATLTVQDDATGGNYGSDYFEVHTLAASAGVPTLSTPDGKTITGSTTKVIFAYRKGTNSWTVGTTDPAASGGGAAPTLDALAASAFGMWAASTCGGSAANVNGAIVAPTLWDSCTSTSSVSPSDLGGYKPRLRYAAQAAAANRGTGTYIATSMNLARLDVGGAFNGGFPWLFEAAVGDAAVGSFFMGFTNGNTPAVLLSTEPTAYAGDIVGVGYDSTGANSSNLGIITSTNGGTPTYTDLGASFAKTQGQLFRLLIDKNAAGTSLTLTVTKVVVGGTDVVAAPVVLTTNLPRATVSLSAQMLRCSMANAATAVTIDLACYIKGRMV